ncbi:MAG: hypothetical protein GXP19_02715, partial [Gammaproteobacteria bacterium]|nr:hypothetical protein [Gammaproteobacteria bacterium]
MDILNSLNLRDSRRSFFLVSSIALTLSACGGGGGGGDPGPGVTPPIGSVVLTEDQAAFEKTVFPLLSNNCSECHSETGNLAHIAHSDVVTAHSVVTSGGFIDFQSPSDSRFVTRLEGGHNCWTASCAADGDTMAVAIAQWNNDGGTGGDPIEPPVVEPPVVEPPVVEPPAGISSPDAFAQSLHPLVVQYCGSCHDGSQALAAFAGPDSQTSHDVTLDKKLANLSNPVVSAVVTFLSVDDHNCWSDCQTNADVLERAVAEWQQLIEGSSTNSDNQPPVANVDSYTTQVNTPLRTESLLLNDSDPDNDILGISAFDETSSQGGAVVNNLNGTFTYTPANGFIGTDTFTYTISDEKGGFDTATVTITVIQP